MKKFLFFAIATAMLGMTFTSCDEKENLNENEKRDDSNKTFSFIGRWDYLPEEAQVGQGEQRLSLIFADSTNVDLYIVAWGDHLKGTYTYENDTLYFSFKREDALDALIVQKDSWGWSASDEALDPETFYLTYTEALPYRWYQMKPEVFKAAMDLVSKFEFKVINAEKASGGPMPGMFFIKRDKIEKTILEGKWSHSERYEYPSGYSIRAEGFTFNKNKDYIYVDTPGHLDFLGEVNRSFNILDLAILLIDGNSSVPADTIRRFHHLKSLRIPILIFLNKFINYI